MAGKAEMTQEDKTYFKKWGKDPMRYGIDSCNQGYQ